MFGGITPFKKIYTLETQQVVGGLLYSKEISFGKFSDSSDYIFNNLLAMTDFWSKGNSYLSVKRISHTIDGVECQPLTAFDFRYGCTPHANSLSDLSLSHTQFYSSFTEKLTNFFKFILHINLFRKIIKCFQYMKHFGL